ncbi:hypothetical protein G7054_g4537 [Neopestalotiopsis clavispora]|nr:hypothetical protein G7054_g4537 [Neopestalotiopsis clavispora]
MAEAFGIASGSVGIASIFSTCVDCFNYIQVGRRFAKDFQTELLTLRLLQLRLSRWGDAVQIYEDPKLGNPRSSDADIALAKDTIYQILVLMADSENLSRRYRLAADDGQNISESSAADQNATMIETLNNRMRTLAQRRQKNVSLIRLATWALHDKEQYSALSENISRLLDQLENLFRATESETKLNDDEIVHVTSGLESVDADTEVLKALHAVAAKFDPVMKSQVAKAMTTGQRNFINIGNIDARGNSKLMDGDFVGKAWKGEAILPTGNTEKRIGFINASESSRLRIGNTYDEVDRFFD